MKPSAVLDTIVQTNFVPADTIEMSIDAVDFGHLMSVLTNLYSDPEGAVLREYSTNAWDAHIMAGQTRPIEVTLPNRLSTYLRIQDFGTGLDLDDIRNIYSKYGKSTKRGDNSQNGMLGLGSKSALTYTSQFNITSVKNGKCYVVSVSINEEQRGEMNIISVYDTTEPNGVTIEIPAKRGHDFETKARDLFRFWEPGTVLVNGREPESVYKVGTKVTDDIYQVDGLRQDYIVLAGVGYPVKEEYQFFTQNTYNRQFGVVYFVKPDKDGSPISHTPNREALFYVPRTIATIEKAQKVFAEKFEASVQANVEAAPNAYQAMLLAEQWNRRYHKVQFENLTYQGTPIPKSIVCPSHKEQQVSKLGIKQDILVQDPWYSYNTNYSRNSTSTSLWINGTTQRHTIVTGYPFATEPSATIRAKTRQWKMDNNDDSTAFLFCVTHPDKFWLADWKVVPFADIKATKLATQKKAKTFTFPLLQTDGTWIDSSIDFENENVLFVSPVNLGGNQYSRKMYGSQAYANVAKTLGGMGYKVILLTANRHEKFKREYNCQPLHSAGNAIMLEYALSLSTSEKELLARKDSDISFAKALVKNARVDVADPDVVDLANTDTAARATLMSKYSRLATLARTIGGVSHLPSVESRKARELSKYPLIAVFRNGYHSRLSAMDYAEIVTYMNARYKEGF